MNTLSPGPVLAAPLRAVVSRLPRYSSSAAFAAALNVTLRRKFPPEVLERLEGHAFAIAVEDAGLELTFLVRGGRFVPAARPSEPLLRIRASAWDYAQLVAQNADPDTLFFNRRLLTEGDTEIALLVKNTLDTIEIPRTRQALRRVLRFLGSRAE
ncbi:MAG TPA: SCP2 sterol-binding domain-containing protein [Gammaproteobacteria bacterium]|nr:SCP2 sterol-binding domain-containing protein [Gammaproteobacteria bacterium]